MYKLNSQIDHTILGNFQWSNIKFFFSGNILYRDFCRRETAFASTTTVRDASASVPQVAPLQFTEVETNGES